MAIPITGKRAWTGEEVLFGWRVECSICGKPVKAGDRVVEIMPSWLKKIVPARQSIDCII